MILEGVEEMRSVERNIRGLECVDDAIDMPAPGDVPSCFGRILRGDREGLSFEIGGLSIKDLHKYDPKMFFGCAGYTTDKKGDRHLLCTMTLYEAQILSGLPVADDAAKSVRRLPLDGGTMAMARMLPQKVVKYVNSVPHRIPETGSASFYISSSWKKDDRCLR
jgi:hypothetical protein